MKYSKKDIENYFSGNFSRNGAVNFLKWLHSDKGNQEYEVFIEESLKEEFSETKGETDQESNNLDTGFAHDQERENPSWASSNKRTWLGWAAGITMLFVIASTFYTYQINRSLKTSNRNYKPIVKTTTRGEKTKFVLPDGSTVHLNSESSISYSENFIEDRNLKLVGEAFFEVSKDSLRPFVVNTESLSTTAIGTSFNIQAYPDLAKIQISLATGRILIKDKVTDQEILMNPKESTSQFHGKNSLTKEQVDIDEILLWKKGVLHFDKTPLS